MTLSHRLLAGHPRYVLRICGLYATDPQDVSECWRPSHSEEDCFYRGGPVDTAAARSRTRRPTANAAITTAA